MKNTIAFLGLCGLLFFSTHSIKAASMGQILGQITDQGSKLPVAFAEIVFENSMDKVVVRSNENGYYYADHLPTGRYTVRIEYNQRQFVMKNVRVYDSYTSEINVAVSKNESLPKTVFLEPKVNLLSSVNSNDIKLDGGESKLQRTQSLNDALSTQPGVDIREGRIFVKGSDQVRIFIDGTPVMGQATQNKVW